jgi:hypothetical protein
MVLGGEWYNNGKTLRQIKVIIYMNTHIRMKDTESITFSF